MFLNLCVYSENFKKFSAGKSPARQLAGGAEIPSDNKENLIFSKETELVSETTSAQTKPFQTFIKHILFGYNLSMKASPAEAPGEQKAKKEEAGGASAHLLF